MTTDTLTATSPAAAQSHAYPDGWRVARLGDFMASDALTLTNGFAQGGFNEDGQGIPHLRPFNVTEDGRIDLGHIKYVPAPRPDSAYWVRQGDIIFNNTNSEELVGKTAFFPFKGAFVLSNHMTRIRVLDSGQIDPAWLAYQFLLQWDHRVFKALCRRHVGQASISLDKLGYLAIPLPPLPEQRAIARVLRVAQEAIAARRRQVTLERERKAALMQRLFTRGTRGEATRQTEIGEAPTSWQVAPLGEIAHISSGGTPNRSMPEYWGGDIPWVKTGEIDYNIIEETEEHITEVGLSNSSAKWVNAGTVLMAMYGQGITRGKVAILGIRATLNQACAAIHLSDEALVDYVFYFLAFSYDAIRNLGHGANQKNLNSLLIQSIRIPLPSLEEQREIADILAACDAQIAALEREMALHDELFRALLEELMSGRLSALGLVEGDEAVEEDAAGVE